MIDLDALPTTTKAPSGATAAPLRRTGQPSLSRRRVLQAMSASSLAVGSGFLSLLAQSRLFPAAAETAPDGRLSWEVCRVDYAPDPDTSGIYTSWQAACNSGSFRGSDYCNSNGWHRKDSVTTDGITANYNSVSNRCWSTADGRNAWWWEARRDSGSPLRAFRCSDGRLIRTVGGTSATYDTVCRALV